MVYRLRLLRFPLTTSSSLLAQEQVAFIEVRALFGYGKRKRASRRRLSRKMWLTLGQLRFLPMVNCWLRPVELIEAQHRSHAPMTLCAYGTSRHDLCVGKSK